MSHVYKNQNELVRDQGEIFVRSICYELIQNSNLNIEGISFLEWNVIKSQTKTSGKDI